MKKPILSIENQTFHKTMRCYEFKTKTCSPRPFGCRHRLSVDGLLDHGGAGMDVGRHQLHTFHFAGIVHRGNRHIFIGSGWRLGRCPSGFFQNPAAQYYHDCLGYCRNDLAGSNGTHHRPAVVRRDSRLLAFHRNLPRRKNQCAMEMVETLRCIPVILTFYSTLKNSNDARSGSVAAISSPSATT